MGTLVMPVDPSACLVADQPTPRCIRPLFRVVVHDTLRSDVAGKVAEERKIAQSAKGPARPVRIIRYLPRIVEQVALAPDVERVKRFASLATCWTRRHCGVFPRRAVHSRSRTGQPMSSAPDLRTRQPTVAAHQAHADNDRAWTAACQSAVPPAKLPLASGAVSSPAPPGSFPSPCADRVGSSPRRSVPAHASGLRPDDPQATGRASLPVEFLHP
jgi:hypothetical protein